MSADDLIFSKHVAAPEGGAALPETKRQESVQPTQPVAIAHAFQEYGSANDLISSVGSKIAMTASTALMEKLGGEAGLNPKGSMLPPLTHADEVYKKAYLTQAHATLGLQANQLITNSNIELANASFLTPELISKNQYKVQQGLQSIYANAPDEVRPQLEYQYTGTLINQHEQLNNRLLSENNQRTRDVTMSFSKKQNQDAYDKELVGDWQGGEVAVQTVKDINDNGLVNGSGISRQQRDANVHDVEVSRFTGRYVAKALAADKDGKLGEFFTELSKDPGPSDIPDNILKDIRGNVYAYFAQRDAMRSRDENYKSQVMLNRIAANPNTISSADFNSYASGVSPNKAAETEFAWIQALKKVQKDNSSQNQLIANYSSGEAHANATEKDRNGAFNELVQQTQIRNPEMSHEDAQVQVAASAGAQVPVFTQKLNNNLTNGKPQQIESAWSQIRQLRDMEAGHVITGLSKQAEAIGNIYDAKKGTMPDTDLARQVTDNITNVKGDLLKTLDSAWDFKLSQEHAGGFGASKTLPGFALNAVGLGSKNFGSKTFETIYGNDIYQQLRSNFYVTRGDYEAALNMTKEYVKQNYGETRVNGDIQTTDKPIEKMLGYSDHDVVPFIHQDIISQLGDQFEKHKTENEYWTTKPLAAKDEQFGRSTFRQTYQPAEVIRHIKTPTGEKKFSYPVNLVGRPGNSWDVMLVTPDGPRNILLVATHQGIISYTPNKDAIKQAYMKR